ncbi:MAG: adenosylmethionine--8-amino-7-oxononanoate transaminase [Myxococcota bacterium]
MDRDRDSRPGSQRVSSADLIDLDRRLLWRPYTGNEEHATVSPLLVERAEGPFIYVQGGRRIFDANASWWCSNLGHRHPRLIAALRRQTEHLVHCAFAGMTHEPAVRLAEELLEVAPAGLARVFFSDNGSTSVEVALKMAIQYFRQNGEPARYRCVTLPGAFHGDTFGAMGVSDLEEFSGIFEPVCVSAFRPEPPQAERSAQETAWPRPHQWGDVVDQVELIMDRHSDEVAAVIVEPLIQGAAGMRVWPEEELRRLREITAKRNVFLIADEVFTGLGRTGAMWACSRAGITPDMLCTAKGLSGGMLPFSATLTTQRVFDGFSGGRERALMHGHTFFGNPLGAAVAREVLSIYREEGVLESLPPKMNAIRTAFERFSRFEGTNHPRSCGMMGAVDLGTGGYHGRLGWEVYQEALKLGALLRPLGDTVYLCPSLTISLEELSELIDIVDEALNRVLTSRV